MGRPWSTALPLLAPAGRCVRCVHAVRVWAGSLPALLSRLLPLLSPSSRAAAASVSQRQWLPRLHRPRPRRATPPSDVSSALAVAGHEDVDKRPSGGSAEETREMDHGNRVLSLESRGW